MSKKIIITGAAGMLGSALCFLLREKGNRVYATDINVDDKTIEFLDVRDYGSVNKYFSTIKPDIVFHLAAETDLEICEFNQNHAYSTNTLGTQNVCIAANNIKTKLVYISTAGVFDGLKLEPYTEFDQPNPIMIYGKAKYEGEKIVEKLMYKYFIVRAGWMIGGGIKDKKFVAKIIKQLTNGETKIFVVTDKFGTPTYTVDFANFIYELSLSEFYGLYHAACTGQGSRFDVAMEIIKILKKKNIELVPVSSEYFSSTYPAPRPKSEILHNYMMELHGWHYMRTWQDALRKYLSEEYAHVVEE